ncbi:unnamed protein product, partial [Vitis vinifera]|uniref:Uncharacterized protein n=1 Tax=Vitis vinifera TaxID=29760 RepID=D7U9S5_VITVI
MLLDILLQSFFHYSKHESEGKLVLQQEQVQPHKINLVTSKNVTQIDCAAVFCAADEIVVKNTHPKHHPGEFHIIILYFTTTIIALFHCLDITSNFCAQSFDVLVTISQEFLGT